MAAADDDDNLLSLRRRTGNHVTAHASQSSGEVCLGADEGLFAEMSQDPLVRQRHLLAHSHALVEGDECRVKDDGGSVEEVEDGAEVVGDTFLITWQVFAKHVDDESDVDCLLSADARLPDDSNLTDASTASASEKVHDVLALAAHAFADDGSLSSG